MSVTPETLITERMIPSGTNSPTDFFQGELIFLFIISISLHNLRTVSGFFLLNNDDSFNVFGLLKSILELDFFYP
jgi:hypothetical protein